jgi:serine/threonine-protein kinase
MKTDGATSSPKEDEDTLDLPASASGNDQTRAARGDETVALPPSVRRDRPSAMALPANVETVAAGGEATLPFVPGAAANETDLEATAPFHGADAANQGTLAHTHAGPGNSLHIPPGAGGDGARFQIVRPHARGGLGEVFVALDQELSREVALKEIQERHADDPVSRTRFLLEAEVTGGLEHPGIVPVYGLGHYRDGRPYYAMRFIRGDSLKEAIDRFHADDKAPGRDPGERELALRGLLRRFVDVCLAMDYAHSRSVIHRDIKPANIMLGPYGETLVVDWGLAKPLDRPSLASEDGPKPLRPMSSSDSAQTMFGSTIGTPHYMSPEQAAGALDVLGPASDIYSLGATLYTLLTGTVPFHEKLLGPLLEKVKRGEFPPPRQVNPRVPPALNAVVLKAMALRPEARYASARALADEIEHWMADEPVAAYPEPWTARARRWARRHRTAVTTAGALLVTAVVGLTAATILIDRERASTEVQRQLAQANFDLARDAVDEMLTELGAVELVDIPQAEGVRRQMLTKARDFYAEFLRKHADNPGLRHAAGQAFGRAGDILEMLGDYDNAEASYRNGLALLAPMAAAPGAGDDLRRDVARLQHGLGVLLKKSLRFREAETALVAAVALRRDLAQDDPDDGEDRKALSESVYMLGAVHARQEKRGPDAQKLYDEAIAARRKMVEDARNQPEDRRFLARFLNNAGILVSRSDRASAEATFREAATLQRELIGVTPNVPAYRWEFARSRSNLGNVFATDRVEAAGAEYDAAVTLFAGLAEEYPAVPDYRYELAVARSNRALLRLNAGQADPAEADLEEARRLLRKLVTDFPSRPDFRLRLAEANRRLGILAQKTSRLEKAAEPMQLALADHRELAQRFPSVPEYRSTLGATLNDLGRLTAQTSGPAAALPIFEEAAREQETALKADGQNRTYREFLYNDLRRIALTRLELKRYADAVEALAAMAKLKPEDADSLCRAGRAIAVVLGRLEGDAELDDSKRSELRARFQPAAIGLLREAVQRGMKDPAEFDHEDYAPLRDVEEFRSLRDAVRAGSFTG